MTAEEYGQLREGCVLAGLSDDKVNGITKGKAYKTCKGLYDYDTEVLCILGDTGNPLLVKHFYSILEPCQEIPKEALRPTVGLQVAMKRLADDLEYLRDDNSPHWDIRYDNGNSLMAIGEQLIHTANSILSHIRGYIGGVGYRNDRNTIHGFNG